VIPALMRAVLLRGHGDYDQLEYREDVPVPKPAAGEVLVRVAAAGVNNTDVNTRIGWYSKTVTAATAQTDAKSGAAAEDGGWTGAPFGFPRVQGADACGRIVAVGSGVDAARIGERVLVDPVLRPRDGGLEDVAYLGADRDGAFAEFVTVPAGNVHGIASEWSDVELAAVPCSWSAAENMLTRAGVTRGETVLVTGASGGVGSAVVQLARRRLARVIAQTATDKAEGIRALGAAEVVPRDADLLARFGSESVDAIIDVVGGPQFPLLLELLRRGGRYAVAGAIAGPVVELDLRTLYLKDLRLLGCTVTEPEIFRNLIGYIERGEVRPVVSATFPLREIAAAQREFLRKGHLGKIVLVP
jgi:NADPH:quinone reductase-like Zn-dependent oxidoreductase